MWSFPGRTFLTYSLSWVQAIVSEWLCLKATVNPKPIMKIEGEKINQHLHTTNGT